MINPDMRLHSRNKAFTVAALIISLYFVPTCIIHAQMEEHSGGEGALVLKEIEVTARRRTEALQDAPVAVTGGSAPSQFDSDSLWNFEAEFKTSWGDNRLVFNGAGFYIDWKDIQTNFIRSGGILKGNET